MELKELKKDELLAKCEELAAENEQLKAELQAAPKGGSKQLQQELASAKEEIEALQGVVADLNTKQILADKTRGSKNPLTTIKVANADVHLEVVHGVRKGQKVYTPKEIAQDPALAEELYSKKSTAVRVVA
jgi:predicted nuclease with TOPRIM domain